MVAQGKGNATPFFVQFFPQSWCYDSITNTENVKRRGVEKVVPPSDHPVCISEQGLRHVSEVL